MHPSDLPIELRELLGEAPDTPAQPSDPTAAFVARARGRLPQTRTIREPHARYYRQSVADVVRRRAQLATLHGECVAVITDVAVEYVVPLGAADLAGWRAEHLGAA